MKIEKGQKYLCVEDYYQHDLNGMKTNTILFNKGKVYNCDIHGQLSANIGTVITKDHSKFRPLSSAKWAIKRTPENEDEVNKWANEVIQGTFVDDSGYVANNINACHAELQDGYTEIDLTTFREITGSGEEKEIKVGDWVVGWHANYMNYNGRAWKITIKEGNYISPDNNISVTSLSDVRHATAEEIAAATEQEIYTIEDVRNGKCAIENDGTVSELATVINNSFPKDTQFVIGFHYHKCKYYGILNHKPEWTCSDETDLPTQSVRLFLKQIEGEKEQPVVSIDGEIQNEDCYDLKNGSCTFSESVEEWAEKTIEILKNSKGEEWQPKWGEEVTAVWDNGQSDVAIYIAKHPKRELHLCLHYQSICMFSEVKPLEIKTFTIDQAKQDLAKLYNINVNQVEIK